MKRFWLVFVCVCLLSLITPQIPMIESSGIPSVPLALADEVTVPLVLADEVTVPLVLADEVTVPLALTNDPDLPPRPPGPIVPNPPPTFPPEPQPPAITHLSGQSRELELEIGKRILSFCAAEKEAIKSKDSSSLSSFFTTLKEKERVADHLLGPGGMRGVWLYYQDDYHQGYKGEPRLDQEIDDPIIVIRDNEALCYLRETIWVRAIGLRTGTIVESAGAYYHTILLEKITNAWVIKYDLFFSDFTPLPRDAPLVQSESIFPSVSGFPSFEEVVNILSQKPSWYEEMLLRSKEETVSPRSNSPDRVIAAQYADQFALTPNTPKYPYFKYWDPENQKWVYVDCSNFVSQCLFEGGWSMDQSGPLNLQWWLYYLWDYRDASSTWRLAGDYEEPDAGLCYYITHNYDQPSSPRGYFMGDGNDWRNLLLGDVLGYKTGNDNYVHHVAICVGYDWDSDPSYFPYPLVDAHSDNLYHAPFHLWMPFNKVNLYRLYYSNNAVAYYLNGSWNLITPGLNSSQTARQIFGAYFKYAFHWDNLNQTYVLVDDQPLQAGLSYWVSMDAAATRYTKGSDTANPFYEPFNPGWAQIGSPFDITIPWSNVSIYYQGTWKYIAAAQASGWVGIAYAWDGFHQIYFPAENFTTGLINPGCGFWLKVNVPCWIAFGR